MTSKSLLWSPPRSEVFSVIVTVAGHDLTEGLHAKSLGLNVRGGLPAPPHDGFT